MTWLREPDTEPIPGYRLVEPLGTGGFGEVWKCIAPGGIHKAIKFVYGNLNTLDDDSVKAEQEFKALDRVKAVRHPFVLSMDRIEVVDGELLIVMELADESLYDLLLTRQKAGKAGIPRDRLIPLLADAAEGLDHLIEKHALQHLDVKPKNLFVVADRVKVADFGLVKHLERQSAAGLMGGITPVYAAPETFTNKISKHSDQYSLGVVYVELLTGQRPFAGKNIRQLAMQHMAEAPDLSRIPEADRPIVARALAKNPDDRFPSCLAFIRSLAGGVGRADVTHGDITLDTPPPVGDRGPGPTPPPTQAAEPRPTVAVNEIDWLPGAPPSGERTVGTSVTFGPEVGVLRPAVLIGVGSFGRKALLQIRCRLLDRIGELSHVPCLRFVNIDPDPEGAAKASAGPADAALLPEHRFATPLQPVTAYRRRHLDQILEWLPREKLYAIPRSLKVDGSRALGRLALSDGFLRFVAKVQNEVAVASHPESLAQSAAQAGLPVRTTTPAVYVFASASGGTGGMLLDIGHAVRRVLGRTHAADAPVTAFVFAGAPDDPSSPPAELANVFATVTELNHYADPDVTFTAQHGGPDGPRVEGHGLPFDGVYLLPLRDRSPEALKDCLSHLAGYVAHDLTTPLGAGLEKQRRKPPPPGRTRFRGFGTFGVWFPRGLLLRSAARQACADLLRRWIAPSGYVPADAEATITGLLTDPRLAPDVVQEYIAQESAAGAGGNPVEKVGQWAAGLAAAADAAGRKPEPTAWAVATWDHTRELLGLEPTTDADSPFRRGKLSKALDAGVKRAAEAWQNEFTERLRVLDDLPGPRTAVMETAVARLLVATQEAAVGGEKRLAGFVEARRAATQEAQSALAGCEAESGGFGLFGNRSARALRALADRLRAFAEVRVKEDMAGAAVRFYRRLALWLAERQRELGVTRERVGRLADLLESPLQLPGASAEAGPEAALTELNTVRVVLPYGEDHLDRAASAMLARVPADELLKLEGVVTKLVMNPRGGLTAAGKGPADLGRHLGGPLVEQATAFLAEQLPAEDVTAVELSASEAIPGEIGRRVQSYLRAAAPAASGPAAEEKTFVVLPDTDAGIRYAAEVSAAAPGATAVTVPGTHTDLLFCREQGWLRPADVFRLLEPCWEPYQQATRGVESNPHARFDVMDWLPLGE